MLGWGGAGVVPWPLVLGAVGGEFFDVGWEGVAGTVGAGLLCGLPPTSRQLARLPLDFG